MDGDVIAPRLLTRHAALFLDVPNLTTRVVPGRERLAMSEVNWPALLKLMLDSLGCNRVTCAASAYVFASVSRLDDRAALHDALLTEIGDYSKVVDVTSSDKDVDPLIVNDMWANLIELSAEQYELGYPFPHQVTVLLAGGDWIYARTISQLRKTFARRGLLNLRLHTFIWRGRLSSQLATESQRVVYLDDYPNILLTGPAS